jgi:hypothetical protein
LERAGPRSIEHNQTADVENALKTGVLRKRVISDKVSWNERFVCLTMDAIEICDNAPYIIRDMLDLIDISEIFVPSPSAEKPLSNLHHVASRVGGHVFSADSSNVDVSRRSGCSCNLSCAL